MAFEEEYNMLDKRIHLQDTITVSLEFLGFVEYEPHECGLVHQYSSWCYNFLGTGRGAYVMGSREITVEAGEGLLIPPYTRHTLYNPGPERMQDLYMGFDCNCFSFIGSLPRGTDTKDILEINQALSKSYYTRAFHQRLSGILCQLEISKDKETLEDCRLTLMEDLLKMYDFCYSWYKKKTPVNPDAFLIQDAKNIIMHNLSRNISIQELSKVLYVSPRKLTSKFLELTGMSFKDYSQMLKMEQASRLLYASGKNISEIAEELGFCDIHYFSKRFKDYYGCSPSTLRKKGDKGVS